MPTDQPDKPELSSAELLRQAREAFAPPSLDETVNTEVDGPSIQDLLSAPLSSESLLPQRSVDHWAKDDSSPTDPAPTAWTHDSPAGHPAATPLPDPPTVSDSAPSPSNSPRLSPPRLSPPPMSQPPMSPPPSSGPPGAAGSKGYTPVAPSRPEAYRSPSPATPPGSATPRPPWETDSRPRVPSQPPQRAPRPLGPPVAPARKSRFSWRLIVAAIVVVGVAISMIANLGTTTASSIDVGDCFENPGEGDVERVTDQDCSGPHEVQAFAEVRANFDTAASATACEAELLEVLESDHMTDLSIILPDDTLMNELGTVGTSSFSLGTVLCTLESPSGGLIGSVLPE